MCLLVLIMVGNAKMKIFVSYLKILELNMIFSFKGDDIPLAMAKHTQEDLESYVEAGPSSYHYGSLVSS